MTDHLKAEDHFADLSVDLYDPTPVIRDRSRGSRKRPSIHPPVWLTRCLAETQRGSLLRPQ
jgi:hypothetical protein